MSKIESKIKSAEDWIKEIRPHYNPDKVTHDVELNGEQVEELIKAAQRQAIEATLEDVAENAKIRAFDGHFQEAKRMEHVQIGANNYTISKESILERINSPELKVI